MPPLEIHLSRHLSASVLRDESTAEPVDHYAAFVHSGDAQDRQSACTLRLRTRMRKARRSSQRGSFEPGWSRWLRYG
jgi:hypothetical protein